MRYEIRIGDTAFPNLSASDALAKLNELIAVGADPFLYDSYGDPMGREELEEVVGNT